MKKRMAKAVRFFILPAPLIESLAWLLSWPLLERSQAFILQGQAERRSVFAAALV